MNGPSEELKAFAAVKGWPVATTDDDRLYCKGREGGVRCFAWTSNPALGPLLTIVVEAKSGLRFDVLPGPTVQPGVLEFERVKGADGQTNIVRINDLPAGVRSWLQTLEPAALTRLGLMQDEKLAVYQVTIAITFPAKDLDHTMDRFATLVGFADLLPKRKPHVLPRQLRPISALIRSWSISDDAKREARLAAASTTELDELLVAWRQHVDVINSTIAARPESSLSTRLMAFSEAATEAEQEQLRRAATGDWLV